MANFDKRYQERKEMFELLDVGRSGVLCFELQTAIMQVEILDEYLAEKIRSDEVLEGLLRDIRAEIERGAETLSFAIVDANVKNADLQDEENQTDPG